MATIHFQKIGRRWTVAAGATNTSKWNNPPWETVLGYTAIPIPPGAVGQHGSSLGCVEVTSVKVTHRRDNDDGDKQFVEISVKNHSGQTIEYDIYQSWIA
jgi:hypothetical protein